MTPYHKLTNKKKFNIIKTLRLEYLGLGRGVGRSLNSVTV